jgi:hypothetical protein
LRTALGPNAGWHEKSLHAQSKSRRIIAKNSSHYVVLDRPDLIEKEVPVFIETAPGFDSATRNLRLNGDRVAAMLHVPKNSDGFNDEAPDSK